MTLEPVRRLDELDSDIKHGGENISHDGKMVAFLRGVRIIIGGGYTRRLP
jgi:hypothetical protein